MSNLFRNLMINRSKVLLRSEIQNAIYVITRLSDDLRALTYNEHYKDNVIETIRECGFSQSFDSFAISHRYDRLYKKIDSNREDYYQFSKNVNDTLFSFLTGFYNSKKPYEYLHSYIIPQIGKIREHLLVIQSQSK